MTIWFERARLGVEVCALILAAVGAFLAYQVLQKQTAALNVVSVAEINSAYTDILWRYGDEYFAAQDLLPDSTAECRVEERLQFFLGNLIEMNLVVQSLMESGDVSSSTVDTLQRHHIQPIKNHVCAQICNAHNEDCWITFTEFFKKRGFQCPCSSLPPGS